MNNLIRRYSFDQACFENLLKLKKTISISLKGKYLPLVIDRTLSSFGMKDLPNVLFLTNEKFNKNILDVVKKNACFLKKSDLELFEEEVQQVEKSVSIEEQVFILQSVLKVQAIQRLDLSCQRIIKCLENKSKEYPNVSVPLRKNLKDYGVMSWNKAIGCYASSFYEATQLRSASCLCATFNSPSLLEANAYCMEELKGSLRETFNVSFRNSDNPLASIGLRNDLLAAYNFAEMVAVALRKLAKDFRLLCSGPSAGINQVSLPALAPGSSIMPGKVNPVILEMAMSGADQINSGHLGLVMSISAGWLELDSQPVTAVRSLFLGCELLASTIDNLIEKCLSGMTPNQDQCEELCQRIRSK